MNSSPSKLHLQRQNAVVFPQPKMVTYQFQDEEFEFMDFDDTPVDPDTNVFIRYKKCSNSNQKESLNSIENYFGKVNITHQFICCDHPECGKDYENLDHTKSVECKKCKRCIDICIEHENLPDHCIFCLDEEHFDTTQIHELENLQEDLDEQDIEEQDIEQLNLQEQAKEEDHQEVNLCLGCGIDLGKYNPRQFCGKTYCENIYS